MIFPVPVKENYTKGSYRLLNSYPAEDLYAFYLTTKEGTPDITYATDETLAAEEYHICIDSQGIIIRSATEQGKFRALTSLRQLLQKHGHNLPFADIQDKPQFAHRAYMYDISRGKVPKVPAILKIVDFLAGLKYNEFQLYMENFCFKYSAFPEYTADFDCLTPEDIATIDKYCADRFIELVPCQNGFGHMATWLKEDRFRHLAVTDGTIQADTLNPLLPESYELMDQIYGSLLPHFSSKRVNICMDEAFGLGKYQLEEPCEKYGHDNIFMDWLEKLDELAAKHGKETVQFWDDMIVTHPECFHRLPKNAIALEWGYDLIQSQIMEGRCIGLKEKGIPFYVCPSTNTYTTLTGRFDVTSFNIRTAAEVGRKHGAIGFMLTHWGSTGNSHSFVWELLPVALGGQYGWNVGIKQHGGWLKPEYIHMSEQYVDENIFHAKVSRRLYQLANYYLLEPERFHGQTMCHMTLCKPLKQMDFPPFYDLNEVGEDLYFENVIHYVSEIIKKVEAINFDETWKRQILMNAQMVILGAEYTLVKLAGTVSREKYDELCTLSQWILAEFQELWLSDSYENGIEIFSTILEERKKELAGFL